MEKELAYTPDFQKVAKAAILVFVRVFGYSIWAKEAGRALYKKGGNGAELNSEDLEFSWSARMQE